MTATAQRPPATKSTTNVPESDGLLSLLNALQGAVSTTDVHRKSVHALAAHFDAPYAVIQIDGTTTNLSEKVSSSAASTDAWKRHCEGMLLGTKYSGKPRARLFQATRTKLAFAVLAVPVPGERESVVGSLALVTECSNGQLAEARLSELASLIRAATLLGTRPEQTPKAESTGAKPAHGTSASKLNGYESLHEFAFSLVNDLKGKIGADQVALGFVRKDTPRLLCMSGFDNLYPRSPGTRLVEQAMAECYDTQEIVCYQQDKEWSDDGANTGHHLHRTWHEESGNAPVASIPLVDGQQCLAVLSIRRAPSKPFKLSELEKIRHVVSPYAAGLALLERANRSVLRHSVDSLISFATSCVSRGTMGRKIVLCAVILMGTWATIGQTSHVVNTPCEIAPERPIHLSAPFEGTIADSFVHPGDEVQAGQLLIRMVTDVLELELRQASVEKEIAVLERSQAAAIRDLAQTALADASVEIADNRMATLRKKIGRAEIRAPQDGSILTGDLRHRVGEVVPLGEPLLQFAESGNWIVKLHIPEFAAAHIRNGMNGKFATNARPDEPGTFEVQHMALTATVVDGRNVFVAEGRIKSESPAWIRSGMQGVARVDAGQKRVWWVWLHGLIDTVRLQVWKW